MSMALAHFAFGAAVTTLAVTYLVPGVQYPRTVALAGGGWAMVPDLHWVSPVAREQLHQFHQTATWADLFWLHRTWDRLDPTDSKAIAAVVLAGFFLTTIIAERRSYRIPAVVETTYEEYLDIESDD